MAMVSLVFGDAIDCRRVRVHSRRYLPFQPKNCAMAPNGHLYFHASCFLDDYAQASATNQHWFLHEMVHVWQHQLGYPVRLRGAIRLGLHYRYVLAPGKALGDFNMEAQGDLLADYFVLKHLDAAASMRQPHYAQRLDLFEEVLASFKRNPSSRRNLPWPRRVFR